MLGIIGMGKLVEVTKLKAGIIKGIRIIEIETSLI